MARNSTTCAALLCVAFLGGCATRPGAPVIPSAAKATPIAAPAAATTVSATAAESQRWFEGWFGLRLGVEAKQQGGALARFKFNPAQARWEGTGIGGHDAASADVDARGRVIGMSAFDLMPSLAECHKLVAARLAGFPATLPGLYTDKSFLVAEKLVGRTLPRGSRLIVADCETYGGQVMFHLRLEAAQDEGGWGPKDAPPGGPHSR